MSSHPPDFAELGVDARIVEALLKDGITAPFPIQAMTLPVALDGHDIIGQAKTGTGKTLGFGIPVMQRVTGPADPGFAEMLDPGKPQALIVVPTRELAVQVAGDLTVAGKLLSARVLTVYGGRAYEPQVEALRKGIEVVVGTPGRLIDLAQQGYLDLSHCRALVLDEADEMLDLGFLPDVEKLLSMTPDGRQTMLFSATMPSAVVALARRYMTQPTHIRASDPTDTGATVMATAQFVYRAHAMDKIEMVARLLQAEGRGLSIIFSRTKRTAAKVADELIDRGFAAASIHGDLGQGAREQALRAFRSGKVDVLVATDVAARGIDVDDVTHVVNYTCPEDEKTYLHRIGRTGRAGNTGVAVTFVDWDDLHRWAMIDRTLDLGIPTAEETYSNTPRFFEDLHIPAGTKGTLPRSARTRAGLDAEVIEDLGETGQRAKPAGRGGGGRDGGGRSGGGRDSGGRSGGGRDGGRDGGGRSGGRDSGGRGHAGGSGSGSTGAASGESRPATGDAEHDGDRPARTRRPRRRTRSGQPVEGDANGTVGTEGGTGGGTAAASAPAGAAGGLANGSSDGGSTNGGSANGGSANGSSANGSSANGSSANGSTDDSGDAPRRRRRRRGGRGGGGGTDTAQATEPQTTDA